MNQIIIDSILCFLGVMIYFLLKYAKRSAKTEPSIKYWFKDNNVEFFATILMNVAMMILIHMKESSIDFTRMLSFLPFDITLPARGTMSFLLGIGWAVAFYKMFKSKENWSREKAS